MGFRLVWLSPALSFLHGGITEPCPALNAPRGAAPPLYKSVFGFFFLFVCFFLEGISFGLGKKSPPIKYDNILSWFFFPFFPPVFFFPAPHAGCCLLGVRPGGAVLEEKEICFITKGGGTAAEGRGRQQRRAHGGSPAPLRGYCWHRVELIPLKHNTMVFQ